MSLHDIVEPAGTLLTGWKMVPADTALGQADRRNHDRARPTDPAEGDRTPAVNGASKWELGEVG